MPKYSKTAITFLASLLFCPGLVFAQEDPLAPENFNTAIAKQIAANLNNPQKLKQLTIGFVDASKAKLSCKLSVFPVYEMVMRLQASAQELEASLQKSREALKAAGLKTDRTDEAGTATMKRFQKETQIKLEQIDEYCGR